MLAPLLYRQTQERIAFLMEVRMFRGLTELQAGKLLTRCIEREYETGATIFDEGDTGKALFIVLSGRVAIVKQTGDGKEMMLTTLGSGSYFGELALLDALPRSAGVRAVEPTKVLILYRSDFEDLVSTRADIGLPVMQEIAGTLAGQLRRMNEELAKARNGGGATVPGEVKSGEDKSAGEK